MKQKGEKLTIPIVFSTNDQYAPYCGVAISSIIQCSSSEYFYQIYILYTELSIHHRIRLRDLRTNNVGIALIDVTEQMKQWNIRSIAYLGSETAYRLLIDKLFPEYEKIVYLDCDVIVCRDISELYCENVNGYALGVIRDSLNEEMQQYVSNSLRVSEQGYFNAGILLINIPVFHKLNVGMSCLDMLDNETKYICGDQDPLNIQCSNKVKFLDPHWNLLWSQILHCTNNGQPVDEPYIVHYAGRIKPWSHPGYCFAEYFWNIARNSIFYEEILQMNLQKNQENSFSKYLFPWDLVPPKSNIIIYGAGVAGRSFLEQIQISKYCSVCAVCDRKYKEIKDLSVPVISIRDICLFDYDMVVVAMEKEPIAQEIIADLLENHVNRNKIVWRVD